MPTQVDASLERVDQFFMAQGPVHKTMRDLARRLECEDIDYSVIGGMALVLHGYERLTVDVDLLMTREGLAKFVELLSTTGCGKRLAEPEKNESGLIRNNSFWVSDPSMKYSRASIVCYDLPRCELTR